MRSAAAGGDGGILLNSSTFKPPMLNFLRTWVVCCCCFTRESNRRLSDSARSFESLADHHCRRRREVEVILQPSYIRVVGGEPVLVPVEIYVGTRTSVRRSGKNGTATNSSKNNHDHDVALPFESF